MSESEEGLTQDEREQLALRKKTAHEASDPHLLIHALAKLGPVERTPKQERQLQEKLNRLQEKIKQLKEQQNK